jgi:hypothetical protein
MATSSRAKALAVSALAMGAAKYPLSNMSLQEFMTSLMR